MDFQDNKNLAQVSTLMIKQQLTLSVAESCTSGLLQMVFSQAENSMSFYQGGLTAYNAGQKAKQLNVNPIFAEDCNSVSKDIAEKMALEVASRFNSEMGISVTGYAEPVPQDGIENSYAYIAITKFNKVLVSKRIMGNASAKLAGNQKIFAEKILDTLVQVLKKAEK